MDTLTTWTKSATRVIQQMLKLGVMPAREQFPNLHAYMPVCVAQEMSVTSPYSLEIWLREWGGYKACPGCKHLKAEERDRRFCNTCKGLGCILDYSADKEETGKNLTRLFGTWKMELQSKGYSKTADPKAANPEIDIELW